MAKTHKAVYPQTPRTGTAVTMAANTNLSDAPDNTVELLTFGPEGGELTGLSVSPRSTCSATAAHVYLQRNGDTAKRLIAGKPIAADTVSGTDESKPVAFDFTETAPFRGATGDKIFVGTGGALSGGFSWVAQFRDF